jgi:YteA family regulatory protein
MFFPLLYKIEIVYLNYLLQRGSMMLSQNQLSQIKTELLKRKHSITNRLNDPDIQTPFSLDASVGELSKYDNHPGDLATEQYEREKDLALHEHLETELEEINIALTKIHNGTYGICEISGKEIPYERLEALPTARTTIENAPEKDVTSLDISVNRPIEEEVLTPPFGKYDLDRDVAYDAEDSLQDVERYGSSQTPGDFNFDIEDYNNTFTNSYENVGFVEDFENFIGTDITGTHKTVYATKKHEKYEKSLDSYEEDALMGELDNQNAKDIDKY